MNTIEIDPGNDLLFENSALNGFNVMFKYSLPISGCPMGRGVTKAAATNDLKRRTATETEAVEIRFINTELMA